MKKGVLTILGVLLCFGLAACAGQQAAPSVSEQSSSQEQYSIQSPADSSAEEAAGSQASESSSVSTDAPAATERKLKMTIDGQEILITLYDTPAANALYDMLPLELTFEDFNGIEKIAYMDNELPTEGEPSEFDPDVGDLCLYAPWGNLSIFYKDFRNSNGLISLGHIDSGIELIQSMQEDFSATLSKDMD
ncbi:cyclophilin-like fold protein [Hydrogeniiclostridium mannosilyticum]|uniref:cyclophilin-like fold protein n=1 Tax=Hydrogeniiclostridium mannosilyticum TaxID=2764322 RepID=UPI0018AA9D84|nr:cyclophilin-like fold protein [Hydrogeniiclostridium mannosilyticum]